MYDIEYRGSRAVFCYGEGENGEEYSHFELTIQCSGAVLIDYRFYNTETNERDFFTGYAGRVLHENGMSGRMYGEDKFIILDLKTLETIAHAVDELRKRNAYDLSLAAGDTIRRLFH